MPQVLQARANPSNPVLNASFEHSRHHGATSCLAAFHARRNPGNVHEIDSVSWSSAIPYDRSAAR
ncbi:hypothetical protein ACFQX7_05155 [Luedemannella flava]